VTSRNQRRARQRMSWRLYSNSPTTVPDPGHLRPPNHDARIAARDSQPLTTLVSHEQHLPQPAQEQAASHASLVPPFPTLPQQRTGCTPHLRKYTQHIDLSRYRRNTADSFHHTSYNDRPFRSQLHECEERARDVQLWTIAGGRRGVGETIL
jgi:hypothetical protein